MSISVDYNRLPAQIDVEVYQGDTYRQGYTFNVTTDAGTNALDFTDCTLALQVSTQRGGSAIALSASQVVVDAASSGQITVVIGAGDTESLGPGLYYYEVVCTFPAGHSLFPADVKTLLQGTLVIRQDAVA